MMPDSDTDCAVISAAGGKADPPTTVSSLEVRIPADLVIQLFRGCTLANASGLMRRSFQTWTPRGVETLSWDNYHHIVLQQQTFWAYWAVAAFYHCLPL